MPARLSRSFCRSQAAYYFSAAKAHACAASTWLDSPDRRRTERKASLACLATAREFARKAGDLW